MKKTLLSLFLVILIIATPVGSVLAQKNKLNLKAEITAIDGDVLTVESNKGETFEIAAPAGFDLASLKVGDAVVIKAEPSEDEGWVAKTIKVVGNGDDDIENPDGFELNSAFCAEDKKTESHPLAGKIAERFGVSEEDVMTYYCQGFSIGEIMLAIKTSQMEGVDASFEELLANREDGNAWGLIWQDMGLVGWEKNEKSPPGQLKKQDNGN
ncbi:hypothetical protein KQH50_00685 [bacterium]|nr:hypothetical protein [bacterium]